MKCYFITTKKQLITITACFLTITTALVCTFSAFATGNRKLPIYCVQNDKKQISISFDAAWGADDTDTLIDILKEYKVKANFFLVGSWVDKYPEEVKRLSDAGHSIQNHSNSHPYMTQLSKEKMVEELNVCNEKIKNVTGTKPTLIRPPYGDYNNSVIEAVESVGMYTIQWSVETLATKVIV